jgi:hypothetical protein
VTGDRAKWPKTGRHPRLQHQQVVARQTGRWERVCQALLADLAKGRPALTQEALRERPDWRTVAYLRDLLMSCGALPSADNNRSMPRPGFTTASASAPAASTSCCSAASGCGTRSHGCAPGRSLLPVAASQCQGSHGQSGSWAGSTNVEVSLGPAPNLTSTPGSPGTEPTRPRPVGPSWSGPWPTATRPGRACPGLLVPSAAPITQARRLVLLRRILTDERPALRSRVAACLVLLYAQPIKRIVRLSVDNIVRDGEGMRTYIWPLVKRAFRLLATLLGRGLSEDAEVTASPKYWLSNGAERPF